MDPSANSTAVPDPDGITPLHDEDPPLVEGKADNNNEDFKTSHASKSDGARIPASAGTPSTPLVLDPTTPADAANVVPDKSIKVPVTTSTTTSTAIPSAVSAPSARAVESPGKAGKNSKKTADRILIAGKADFDRCDNKVISSRYTALTFLPVAIMEQFRRFANLYFLCIGLIMFLGYYTEYFDTAVSPWTTLGPLAIVVSISLLVEGSADYKRHKNDEEMNSAKCVILRRANDIDQPMQSKQRGKKEKAERDDMIMNGKDVVVNLNKAFIVKSDVTSSGGYLRQNTVATENDNDSDTVSIAFQKVERKDIRQGHFVLVKNREMVPADIILLASSNDQGCTYIETSSIDGETNLKLRLSPQIPKTILKALRDGKSMTSITEDEQEVEDDNEQAKIETVDAATKRLTRFSSLGRPDGVAALYHPSVYSKNMSAIQAALDEKDARAENWFTSSFTPSDRKGGRDGRSSLLQNPHITPETKYVATLTSESPNASVHTFSGKLTFPPLDANSPCYEIPLGAENILLRGAVVRNTEWVIGLACFTGPDTKLVQNSFKTPSKFSQLDVLMNKTVMLILVVLICMVTYLGIQAVVQNENEFDSLFYVGFNRNTSEPWPYLPESFDPPDWSSKPTTWLQAVFLFITLLNNFIPLSLYMTVEFVTWCMLWFIYADIEMYDDTTNTRAIARSTIVSDLGRIQYIFSDKTGTLTQNVMRFKRCSVDGIVFGAPIQRSKPGETNEEAEFRRSNEATKTKDEQDKEEDEDVSPFLPMNRLLVGRITQTRQPGLEGFGESSDAIEMFLPDKKLTFNAEMFLRVMSLCHTVVVEKDIDKKQTIDSGVSVVSTTSNTKSLTNFAKNMLKPRKRTDTSGSGIGITSPLSSVAEEGTAVFTDENNIISNDTIAMSGNRGRVSSVNSLPSNQDMFQKNDDGAPIGYAYQAESPDEGALVSAASSTFGFQVVQRDTNGIRLRCYVPSHLQDMNLTQALKHKQTNLKRLAALTASSHDITDSRTGDQNGNPNTASSLAPEVREETWSILAINKFDSDRKRMSILLRSPPELGSLPILFCKGADSSMLDPEVCENFHLIQEGGTGKSTKQLLKKSERDVSVLSTVSESGDDEDTSYEGSNVAIAEEWDIAQMLGIQVHLGEFAKEGLRTLVLGMKVLTERECTEWLDLHKVASTSMKKRSEMLTAAAKKIETGLHIVGATAIEDKLQKRVPETIATLGKAGIKLWVLTGDKRETAVEIGYSTHVLTPKMHLTEVPDKGKHYVRTQMAMEFIRLTKIGRLPLYQKAALDNQGPKEFKQKVRLVGDEFLFFMGIVHRIMIRFWLRCGLLLFTLLGSKTMADTRRMKLKSSIEAEKIRLMDVDRRRKVRARAERTIRKWLQSEEGMQHRKSSPELRDSMVRSQEDMEVALTSEDTPVVFTRAASAKFILNDLHGDMTSSEFRKLSLAHMTASQVVSKKSLREKPLIDEDTLSLESFVPTAEGDLRGDYDKKKRTILERMFAIDRDVRKGRLTKHLTKERLQAIKEEKLQKEKPSSTRSLDIAIRPETVRALVIEGAALKHLLGEPDFEEILFAVASNCSAVIACRVSPKQKAELVNLVRKNVRPEPITLAIGDGANDVGMIQEAHVGVGISGKEGQQAVNASDFAIAQFRFLETLVLIHGRWNFFRLSTVVLFSFYKNALMAGMIVIYTTKTLYSGTPLFDEWVISFLNFVAGWPIVMCGLFDRCLSKDYVRKHPEVYKATRENELITFRTLMRWVCMVFLHMWILYYFTIPVQTLGGGITPAFQGLMRNNDFDRPGDGEGGDLKSAGTVTYSCLVVLLAYKVLFETRSLVHGRWPSFTCRKGVGEGVFSRLHYTWIGVTYLSVGFYFFAIGMYSLVGRKGASEFSGYVDVAKYVMTTRSLNWILIAFIPVMAIIFDLTLKVFSNMHFPTQTQIHLEMESHAKMKARLQGKISSRQQRRPSRGNHNV